MKKKLGKIESARFGLGGYQGVKLGLSVTLSGKDWDVSDFKGTWDAESVQRSKSTQWTEEERSKGYDDTMRYISKLLNEAKVTSVDKLKGIPVECTFDGDLLKEWRVLTEVL